MIHSGSLLVITASLALSVACPILAGAARAAEQPNVIIFLADDMGWADVGYKGSPIETPSLDRLAREGTRLERFYATPVCSPTRAALMTGRDPMRLGIIYHALMPWHNHGVAFDERFMPEAFRDAGYQTAMIGKWHLGHTFPEHLPNARGFDHSYGHLLTAVDFFEHTIQGGYDFQRNGKSLKGEDEGEYATTLAGHEAVRWIRARDKSKPFFLYIPFLAPHNPMQAPKDLIAKYDFIPENTPNQRPFDRRINAAMIDALDQAIGWTLDALDEQGIADETLVLFFSDNGGSVANGSSNAPLRGWKLQTFEGGIRVLAVARWPKRLPAGARSDQLMTVADIFPTVASAAGVPVGAAKPIEGRDVWQGLTSGTPIERDDDLFFTCETAIEDIYFHAVIHDEWKLVQKEDHVLEQLTLTNYLFRIRDDPNEEHDLAAENPEVVADLSARIHDWRALHPLGGTGTGLVPHPGWRPPRDWADLAPAMGAIQNTDVSGEDLSMGLPHLPGIREQLQRAYGDRGRMLYDADLD
ncbi:MAG: arylsulfatase [Deltaproteobacteria bacterium]|nr:arylsulfatase [Deltaproteobacteria bacterium]MBW2698552.1 arylsulfatase [Deltaproteobacteria bacterium]